jgi:penicillin-binding protein 1A
VKLRDVAPVLVHAVVDTEDASFWDHGGVEPRAILRATAHNVLSRRTREGGSTITQQLVKNTLLTRDRNVQRKLKELVLADRVERRIGKRAVLERYLNTVYFGNGAYGVQAAAETYFGRSAHDVDLPQAALLAGLIQSPNRYDPLHDPDAARGRRSTVLDRLVDRHHVHQASATEADHAALPTKVNHPPRPDGYFTAAVTRELLDDERLGDTVAERSRKIYRGGLRIRTTVDPGLERLAQDVVRRGVPGGHHLTGALVAIDVPTGGVRALVGGTDFDQMQYDAAAAGAGRQPGSAFKAFTLVAALEAGQRSDAPVDGTSPCPIPNPGGTPDPWTPGNYDGDTAGVLSLQDATAHSVNCAYARLAAGLGSERIIDVARRLGVTAPLASVPSLTLGTSPVPPLQMAGAYATLAADGTAHPAHLVDRVEGPDGAAIVDGPPAGRHAVDPEIARRATSVLTHVLTDGTGRRAALGDRPAAGKTGTAQGYQDAWFVGYTPELAAAVWMGDPGGEVPMRGIEGIDVVGGSFPASMWHEFMATALAGVAPAPFPAPQPLPGEPQPAPGAPGHGRSWCWTSCGHKGPPPPGFGHG